MVVITLKLASHTKFWSVMLFVGISLLSLGLYIIYLWISQYRLLSVYVQGVSYMFFTSG